MHKFVYSFLSPGRQREFASILNSLLHMGNAAAAPQFAVIVRAIDTLLIKSSRDMSKIKFTQAQGRDSQSLGSARSAQGLLCCWQSVLGCRWLPRRVILRERGRRFDA